MEIGNTQIEQKLPRGKVTDQVAFIQKFHTHKGKPGAQQKNRLTKASACPGGG